jgi:hypothetical protein
MLIALCDQSVSAESTDPWKKQRQLAEAWLSRNSLAESRQSIAMRLLVGERIGITEDVARPLLKSFLRLQNEDGGWSQTDELKSDAFATGLALYVLSQQKVEGLGAEIGRAQAFLVKTQQADGSWPMKSRPSEPTGPGPARDLRPISYFGTAWATIGLVRSSPEHDIER